MNASSERSKSLWMSTTSVTEAPALTRNGRADVVVVGAGIAGLSTAYELAKTGKSVVVLDRGPLGGGMTARTTGHLASELDDYYHELIEVRGSMRQGRSMVRRPPRSTASKQSCARKESTVIFVASTVTSSWPQKPIRLFLRRSSRPRARSDRV